MSHSQRSSQHILDDPNQGPEPVLFITLISQALLNIGRGILSVYREPKKVLKDR